MPNHPPPFTPDEADEIQDFVGILSHQVSLEVKRVAPGDDNTVHVRNGILLGVAALARAIGETIVKVSQRGST